MAARWLAPAFALAALTLAAGESRAKNGDLIVKVVNASGKPYKAALQINGAQLNGTAELITLTADFPTSENERRENEITINYVYKKEG